MKHQKYWTPMIKNSSALYIYATNMFKKVMTELLAKEEYKAVNSCKVTPQPPNANESPN